MVNEQAGQSKWPPWAQALGLDATRTVVNSQSFPATSESVHDAFDAVSEASHELRSAQPGRIGDGRRVCWEDE